jgi:hypothetical protein
MVFAGVTITGMPDFAEFYIKGDKFDALLFGAI